MDKQARKLSTPREDGVPFEAGSEGGSNEESDQDEKVGEAYFYNFDICMRCFVVAWFVGIFVCTLEDIAFLDLIVCGVVESMYWVSEELISYQVFYF